MNKHNVYRAIAGVGAVLTLASPAAAHFVAFKSPNPGMHFTQGQPLVVFADMFDDRESKGIIVCPNGETISNMSPPPDYSDPPRTAQCSGGGTPTGWPAFQVLIDTSKQTDLVSGKDTIQNTIAFNHDGNPDPIGFFRFVADTKNLSVGTHQVVVRGLFSNDAINIEQLDSKPMTVTIDAPPAKTVVSLDADFSGAVNWDNVIVEGNGHAVTAKDSIFIHNSLVTGISGVGGSVSDVSIEDSIFEDSGEIDLTLGDGTTSIKNDEFRANNRLTFVANDPSVPFILSFDGGGTGAKVFQGNRVGAGQLHFGGRNWLIGGDTDAESNIFIGPRSVLNISGADVTIRGNYSHHNYRGAWSQGFNFDYYRADSSVLTEHNFIRDSSWPVQSLAGEFRYNVVYGYGHTWVRSTQSNASIHHNIFAPGGDGGLNAGIQCYGGDSGLLVYNNTFDGGGSALGDFAGPTIDMSGGSAVASLRNNLITFSRNQNNTSPGDDRVVGGAGAYVYADYNAFYSPDNDNKTGYDFTGAGAHDAADGANNQLASDPFAGARIMTDSARDIESTIDEGAIWQGTQKVSQVLAIFRDRYSPKAGSAIIDAGDPADNDSQGRRTDIGAVDLDGHDQDHIGKFGTPPAELVPPTVTLTAPTSGAELTGTVTLSATATDNAGGTGVVLVQFLVDGATVGQTATSPYSVSFDTATVVNGDHAFSAKAWDAAGNSAVSDVVTTHTNNVMVVGVDGGTSSGGATGAGGNGQSGTTTAGGTTGGGAANGGTTGGGASNGGAPTGGTDDSGSGGSDSGGCGCRIAGEGTDPLPEALAVGVALAALGRRRRRATA